MSSVYQWAVMLGLTALFALSGQVKRGGRYLAVFVLLYLLDELLMEQVTGEALSFLSMLAIGGRLMLPCFTAGAYILHTTSAHALIHGLRRWHVPEQLLLTLAVMLRFLPTLPQDYRIIKQSLRLRGIVLSQWDILRQPFRYFEYVLIPLLMSAVRTSQDLTVATLTKAVASKGKKTSYRTYNLGVQDYLLFAGMAVLAILIQLGVG